ncbi:AAA family ATPase [Umezawaea sp. NPDC059074]|uniref:AAA family ATPase n=1 Tax=Umezawaea sp. NPDC059074 TaxID=3346716 RepID=UPI0036AE09BA
MRVRRARRGPGGFVRRVRVEPLSDTRRYPYTLPAVKALIGDGLDLDAGVTFLVGENGSGKSTLVEAMAVACGFNAEGGSQNFRFATRATESSLGDELVLSWSGRKPQTGFFLRAESYYNVATEIERLGHLRSYGGVSPHERSHGESFVDLVSHRFGPEGLYFLDEPEAALSVRGCLAVLARLADLSTQGCQFVVATHSPVLLALPEATIFEIDEDGAITRTTYDEALPVRLMREFLARPETYLRHLLAEDS